MGLGPHPALIRSHHNLTNVITNYICNDLISKQDHILRCWESGLQYSFTEGWEESHNSIHNRVLYPDCKKAKTKTNLKGARWEEDQLVQRESRISVLSNFPLKPCKRESEMKHLVLKEKNQSTKLKICTLQNYDFLNQVKMEGICHQ